MHHYWHTVQVFSHINAKLKSLWEYYKLLLSEDETWFASKLIYESSLKTTFHYCRSPDLTNSPTKIWRGTIIA